MPRHRRARASVWAVQVCGCSTTATGSTACGVGVQRPKGCRRRSVARPAIGCRGARGGRCRGPARSCRCAVKPGCGLRRGAPEASRSGSAAMLRRRVVVLRLADIQPGQAWKIVFNEGDMVDPQDSGIAGGGLPDGGGGDVGIAASGGVEGLRPPADDHPARGGLRAGHRRNRPAGRGLWARGGHSGSGRAARPMRTSAGWPVQLRAVGQKRADERRPERTGRGPRSGRPLQAQTPAQGAHLAGLVIVVGVIAVDHKALVAIAAFDKAGVCGMVSQTRG